MQISIYLLQQVCKLPGKVARKYFMLGKEFVSWRGLTLSLKKL